MSLGNRLRLRWDQSITINGLGYRYGSVPFVSSKMKPNREIITSKFKKTFRSEYFRWIDYFKANLATEITWFNITRLSFFSEQQVKGSVHKNRPNTTNELKDAINTFTRAIPRQTLQDIFQGMYWTWRTTLSTVLVKFLKVFSHIPCYKYLFCNGILIAGRFFAHPVVYDHV